MLQWISEINNDLINTIKNVAVLIFFVFLLIVIGIYEIRKFYKEQRKPQEEIELEVREIFPSAPVTEDPKIIFGEAVLAEDFNIKISEEEETDDKSYKEPERDFTY